MKRIGILTLHRANNFGAVLQNYALQKAINSLGYECETIDYKIPQVDQAYKNVTIRKDKNPIRKLAGLYWDMLNLKQGRENTYKFNEFRNKYIKLSSKTYDSMTINEATYDLYIVGSDQVWNTQIIKNDNINTFSLGFTGSKKAAYAVSSGSVELMIPLDNIKKFDYITAREMELCEYLDKHHIHSKIVCDPTLLLTKKDWQKLIRDIKIDHSGYVYLYYVDGRRSEAACIAKDFAKKNSLDVVYSRRLDHQAELNNYGINRFSDGPLEFIKEIECADFVVVSSFHGVVFSILMEKNFIALLHESTGSRVKSILSKVGLQDRIVNSIDDYQSGKFPAIDYSKVRPIVENWRKESLEELRKICEL